MVLKVLAPDRKPKKWEECISFEKNLGHFGENAQDFKFFNRDFLLYKAQQSCGMCRGLW